MVFGSIGFSYFIYGKKQKHSTAFLAGIGLMGFSYFISNVWLMVGIGGVLMAIPFAFKE
jgi:hypothetical protein